MRPLLELNRDKALIFRIVHRDNVPWILDHGLHCDSSPVRDPNYVAIGDPELIGKRRRHPVPLPPGGTLDDYIPFYFTPRSPMLGNILRGRGVIRRDPGEIVIIAMQLTDISAAGVPFVFTDRHAYGLDPNFFDDLRRLDRIDWDILQRSDFKHDVDDPRKVSRYQAEALIHRTIDLTRLAGLACYDRATEALVAGWIAARGLRLKVFVRQTWFPL